MAIAETRDLVLGHLAGDADEPSATLADLTAVLSSSSPRLSQQCELAATVEGLREDGLAERRESEEGPARLVLTEDGERTATAVRDRLAETPIELAQPDGSDRRELALADAAETVDCPLVAVAAAATDDGRFHPTTEAADDATEPIGRERILQRWRECRDRVAAEDGGRALAITGPGGIGKTTVLEAAVADAREAGHTVLEGRCRGAGSEAFQPIRSALSSLPDPPDAGPFPREPRSHGGAERRQAERRARFEAVTDLIVGEGEGPPRVLAIDDVHDADPASLAYLEYILTHLADLPLVVLLTGRRAALPDAIADALDGDLPATAASLEPLSPDGTRRLIERVLERRGAPSALVEAVHDRTGGNPLYVQATVTKLLEDGQLDPYYDWYPTAPADVDVPRDVRETVEDRIDSLDDRALTILQWAAVLGDRVDVDVLAAVADRPRVAVETTVELLVASGAFEWAAAGTLQFRSDVLLEGVRDGMADDERRRRHGVVADHLIASGRAEDEPAAVADHAERAGRPAQAAAYYREAGERAKERYAFETAIQHYHAAVELAREGGDGDDVVDLATRLADVYVTVGEYDRAERHAAFARDDAATPDLRLARVEAAVAAERGEYDRAIGVCEDALEAASEPTESTARLLRVATRAYLEQGRYEEASEMADRLDAAALAVGDDRFRAAAAVKRGRIARQQRDYAAAAAHLERALEICQSADDTHGVAHTRNNLGAVAWFREEYERARELFAAALEAYEAVGDRHGAAKARMHLGNALLSLGERERAREHLESALATFDRIGDRHEAARAHHNLASLAGLGDDPETAREHYRAAVDAHQAVGDAHSAGKSRLNLADTLVKLGDLEDACRHYERVLESLDAVGDDRSAGSACRGLAEAALERGDRRAARAHARAAIDRLEDQRAALLTAAAMRVLVECDLEVGDRERAHERCERALEVLADRPDDGMGDRGETAEWFARTLRELEADLAAD